MSSHTASWGRGARIIFAAVVATTLCVSASQAQVSTKDGDIPSIAVRYSDLNLATEEGSRVLYSRLVAAAQQVCPQKGYVMELRQNRDAQRCIVSSVEQAVKQVRSPQLAQVARSQMR